MMGPTSGSLAGSIVPTLVGNRFRLICSPLANRVEGPARTQIKLALTKYNNHRVIPRPFFAPIVLDLLSGMLSLCLQDLWLILDELGGIVLGVVITGMRIVSRGVEERMYSASCVDIIIS